MDERKIELRFEDPEGLEREYASNLRSGGAFLRDERELNDQARCVVALVHPKNKAVFELPARVVWVAPTGVGVQFEGFDEAVAGALERFIAEPPSPPPTRKRLALNVNERLRGLNPNEQRRIAREGDGTERAALERIYGKNVWEHLLSNPRITAPEVARIARMGALPKPLLDRICATSAWLRMGPVRRALLTHPRLSKENAQRVLSASPRPELQLIAQQTIYPRLVREIAQRIVQRGSR